MNISKERRLARKKRQVRVRKKVTGSVERPRLCIFRSTKHIYAQIIEDETGKTLPGKAAHGILLVIAAGENHARVGPDPADLAIRLFAAHFWHGHVEHHDGDLVAMPSVRLYTLSPVGGGQHAEAGLGEHRFECRPGRDPDQR